MGTFGRTVFCEVRTQIVGKTKFFDSLRALPVRERPSLIYLQNSLRTSIYLTISSTTLSKPSTPLLIERS